MAEMAFWAYNLCKRTTSVALHQDQHDERGTTTRTHGNNPGLWPSLAKPQGHLHISWVLPLSAFENKINISRVKKETRSSNAAASRGRTVHTEWTEVNLQQIPHAGLAW